jgi:hypothetical protein
MPNALQAAGSQGRKQTAAAPIFTNRFFTGLWTQRNPLRDAATQYLVEKFYTGARFDSLIDGLNVELSNKLTLKRRPGSSLYNTNTLPAVNRFYEFRQNYTGTEQISVIADTAPAVYDVTAPNLNLFFTKSAGSNQTFFQSVGNVLYFSNGVDAKKYYLNSSSTFVVQNWGISNAQSTYGPTTATTGTQSGTGTAWTNPSDVTGTSGFATVTVAPGAGAQSEVLAAGGYSFAIPSTTQITGVQVNITLQNNAQIANNGSFQGYAVVSLYNSTYGILGTAVKYLPQSTTPLTFNFGGPSDLWGASTLPASFFNGTTFYVNIQLFGDLFTGQEWICPGETMATATKFINGETVKQTVFPPGNGATATLINNTTGYGVSGAAYTGPYSGILDPPGLVQGLIGQTSGAEMYFDTSSGPSLYATAQSYTLEVQNVQVEIFSGGLPNVTPGGSGSFQAVNGGYQYEICYGNGNLTPPVVSSPTLPSTSTGNFTGKAYISIPVVASPDPQVNQIKIFRTTDGGALFFEIPGSPFPNTTATIQDDALNIAGGTAGDNLLNIFSSPPAQLENNPPPAGMINSCYHLGRIIGSVGNTMYIGDGPDNPFNGNEAFPPGNNYVLPSTIVRFVPLTQGILIFTTASCYFSANGGANGDYPQQPAEYMAGKVGGVLSYNALDVVGSSIYLVNSKRMVKQIDISSGESEVGFPIGDLLSNTSNYVQFGIDGSYPGISPSSCYMAYHEQDSTDSALYLANPGPGIDEQIQTLVVLDELVTITIFVNGFGNYSWALVGNQVEIEGTGLTDGGPFTIATSQIAWQQSLARGRLHGTLTITLTNPSALNGSENNTGTVIALDDTAGPNVAWWFRLNPTPAPETGVTWSPRAVLPLGFSAVQSVETQPGVHQLLMGPGSSGGQILYRDTTQNADNQVPFPAYANIGSILLAHPGQVALLYFITTDCVAIGSRPVVSILMDEIGGHAELAALGAVLGISTPDPPQLGPAESETIYNDRWWMSGSQEPAMCRHLQIEIAWPAENEPNELLTYTLFGEHYQEI